MTIDIRPGDCREVIKTLADNSIDACVTDPPYHLVAMTKRFGAAGSAPAKSADHQRIARGFMLTEWDGTGIAFDPELWAEVLRVLKPGGFCLAFGAPRTYHRLACAIEDAGFVIQDCIMWMFGQGWPKRRDMLKPGYEPVVMAYKPGGRRYLNIEGCRVEADGRPLRELDAKETAANVYVGRVRGDASFSGGSKAVGSTDLGRWPANVILDGSEEVISGFPESAGQQGDLNETGRSRPSKICYGDLPPPRPHKARRDGEASANRRYTEEGSTDFAMLPGERRTDGGSASRYFYHAKADKQDRWGSRHPSIKPIDLIQYLVRLVTPPGGTVLDLFAGSGTCGVAAMREGVDAILIEREDQYVADIRERMAFYDGGGRHSTSAKARSAVPRGTLPLFDE